MNSYKSPKQPRDYSRISVSILLLMICVSGCAGMPLLSRKQSLEEKIENDPNYSIAGVQGPTERNLRNTRWKKDREHLERNTDADMTAALAEYDRGQKLYDAKNYPAAEKVFRNLVQSRRDTYESVGAKWNRWWGVSSADAYDPYSNFGDPIEEDALFMLGESHFAQFRYTKAQDSYDDLLNRYPSTRHLDLVTRNLFTIARHWLDFPDSIDETGDASIQLASNSKGEPVPPGNREPKKRLALVPNLTDTSRPTFDTYGRGLQALRSIWLHDATGPLADDALMLSANHHLRTANFVEAARMYQLVREQYPDSPHFKDAFMLGSHVTLASYQGPAYDGNALEEARNLKETMLQIFPNLTPEERERLEREVVRMNEAEIARLWNEVEFYQAKKVPESITLYCHLIINRYPDSRYAEMARKVLIEEQEKARKKKNSIWPNFSARQPAPKQPTRNQIAPIAPKEDSELTLPADPEPKSSIFGRFGNMLRRAEQPPKLRSIDEAETDTDEIEDVGSASL